MKREIPSYLDTSKNETGDSKLIMLRYVAADKEGDVGSEELARLFFSIVNLAMACWDYECYRKVA